MNLRTAWLVVAACVLLAAGARSQGKDVTISDDDQTTIVDCNAGTATVSGDDNKVTIKGDCRALTVRGDDNVITAATVNDLSISGDDNTLTVDNVARINVTGDDNSITWKLGVGGKRPEISDQGDDNKIREAK